MKQVTVIIRTMPEELRVRIKIFAAQHRISMQQAIIDAVEMMLEREVEQDGNKQH